MKYGKSKLKELTLIKTGKLDSNAAVSNGIYPFFTCDPNTLRINTWAYNTEAVLLAGNNASGNYTAKYYNGQFNAYQRTYIIESADKEVLNVRYLAYAMNKELKLLKTMSAGSTTKFLKIGMLHNLEISLPDIDVQKRIAEILSSYDNLIENNQKQIKLLEEAAQRLYKEWFVDLRFPGYEDTEIVDGIPAGWSYKTVAESLEMNISGGWGKETPTGKNTIKGKVIRGTDISDVKNGLFSGVPVRYHTENDIQKRSLHSYDLVFELSNGNIKNIGRCLLIDDLLLGNCGENTICASFCKLLRPIDMLHSIIMYFEINDMQISGRMMPLKKHGSNGINNFDFDGFLNHSYLVPDDKQLIVPFVDTMEKINNCQCQLAVLKEARERLLPKLMSGELEV